MTAFDRIVLRALLNGNVEFDTAMPNRFAKIGHVRLYRPLGVERWALLFGHDTRDYGMDLGWIARTAMRIAARQKEVTP